jgi:hypothetical protein
MYALTFVHLLADFPYRSPWSDMSKTTDEGWYGGGALHHFVFGHWYLPNAFNPAVAMPAWPVMLGGWFSIAGVGMLQARVLTVMLYGVSLVLVAVLLRESRCAWLTCAAAVLLIAANPFCYVFDRMALLEPVSVFWWLLALWTAGWAAGGGWWRSVVAGFLMVTLVWTKTTSLVLLASILYFLFARARERRREWVGPVFLASATAVVLWCGYFFAWVRPRYLKDFRFVFAINADRAHLRILPEVTWKLLVSGLWTNAVLFPAGLLMVVVAAIWLRRLWHSPLFTACVLAVAGQLAFVLYHGNFQPRYYLIAAAPMVVVIVMGLEEVWHRGLERTAIAAASLLLVTAVVMTVKTTAYVRHPAYTFRDMAVSVAETMRAGGDPGAVLFSGAGDDISLFTGVRAVSFYEPMGLEPLLNTYRPGWMGAWLDWEEKFPAQVSPYYEMQPVASFRVYDDEIGHKVFVLYRMTPRMGTSHAVLK